MYDSILGEAIISSEYFWPRNLSVFEDIALLTNNIVNNPSKKYKLTKLPKCINVIELIDYSENCVYSVGVR